MEPDAILPTTAPELRVTFREIATNAIRFWELRRIVYNAVLAIVVLSSFYRAWPASRQLLTFEISFGLFVFAMLANVVYCAAYFVDVFAQLSDLRPIWLRWRWTLFVLGLVFAGLIALELSQSVCLPRLD